MDEPKVSVKKTESMVYFQVDSIDIQQGKATNTYRLGQEFKDGEKTRKVQKIDIDFRSVQAKIMFDDGVHLAFVGYPFIAQMREAMPVAANQEPVPSNS